MNEVLKNWIEIKLEKICSRITKGGTPTTYGYAFQKEGINFIKVENLNKGTVDLRSISDFISQEAHDFQKKSQLQEGDLLFSIAGTIGETCIVKKEILPANTNQALAIIQGFHKVLTPNFLKFQLDSFVARKVTSKARGGAMNNVSLGDLKNLDVLIPPVPEQRAIVAKIEQLFSELDNGVTNLKAAKDKLEIYRQAVLKKAFEGAFTADWRRDQDFDTTWEDTVLGKIAKWGSGGTPSRKIDEYFTGNIPWLKTGELGSMYVDDAEEKITEEAILKSSAKVFPKGSVGIAMYGATIGKTSIFNAPLATNQACAVAQPNEDIDAVFLYYYILSQKYDLIRKGQGGAQPNISQGILKEHPISVPKIEEQNQIVQEIEFRLSVCDNILTNIEEGLDKSEALRQSILKQAFEGKLLSDEELEACRQEPDWEPAEKLLERVKIQKEVTV